jgi:hypothetical protein
VDLSWVVLSLLVQTCYCHHPQKQRSHQKHDFFKRTKTGQPVMKVRVDKILATLQQEKQQQGRQQQQQQQRGRFKTGSGAGQLA